MHARHSNDAPNHIYWNIAVNFYIVWETEPGDRVEIDEPIAQVETDKVLCLLLFIKKW